MDFSVTIYNKKIRQDFLVESGYQRTVHSVESISGISFLSRTDAEIEINIILRRNLNQLTDERRKTFQSNIGLL